MGYMKNLYEDIWEAHCMNENLTYDEIAELLNCPVSYVESAIVQHYDYIAERNGK